MTDSRDDKPVARAPEFRVAPDARPNLHLKRAKRQSYDRVAATLRVTDVEPREPRLAAAPHADGGGLARERISQPQPQSRTQSRPQARQQPRAQIQAAVQMQPQLPLEEPGETVQRYRRGEREVYNRRRRRRIYALRRLMPPVLVFVLCMFCAFLWSSGAATSILNSTTNFFLAQSEKAGLVVENVSIQGRKKLSEVELREALGITKGTPIFAVDPEEARARVSSVGWVKTAAVTRELPNTIKVVITERTPAALWQRDGVMTLIDTTGYPITSEDLEYYSHLPHVVGKGADVAAAALINLVQAEPSLTPHVKAAVRVGERRWDVVFKNGVRARLPEGAPEVAWARLANLNREHNLLNREIHIIDLRQSDRLVLRLTDPEINRRKEMLAPKPEGARV